MARKTASFGHGSACALSFAIWNGYGVTAARRGVSAVSLPGHDRGVFRYLRESDPDVSAAHRVHSQRSADIGSRRPARRAGTKPAMAAQTSRIRTAPANAG